MQATYAKLIGMASVAVLLSGCTNMTRSIGLDAEASTGFACHSNVGAYNLPRRLIEVRVKKGVDDGYGINIKEGKLVADKSETYCLDFLLSGYAEDRIGIERTPGGLLSRIYTKSEDQSGEITKKLIQAGADLAASSQARLRSQRDSIFAEGVGEDQTSFLRFFEFDPMRESELRDVNLALRPYGYCLHFGNRNDQFAPDWAEDICKSLEDGPYKPSTERSGLEIIEDGPVPPSKQRGVLYRPEITHKLTILRQDNPGVSGAPWHRVGSKSVALPNTAPAFLLKVKRAMFVTAETDIKFDNGLMQSIAIDKPSELEAATELLVEAVQIVTKIPTQALNIFHNRAGNTKALIAVNQEMITQLEKQNEATGATPRTELSSDVTNLILNRSQQTNRSFTAESARSLNGFTECLSDPAIEQYDDPVAVCRHLVLNNR